MSRALCATAAAAALLWTAAPERAAAQSSSALSGQLATSAGVTDNVNLDDDQLAVADGFSTVSPALLYTAEGRRSIHVASYRFDALLYYEHSEANSYSNQLSLTGLYLLSRRLRLNLSAQLAQGETNNFQLVQDGAGVISAQDGGVSFLSLGAGQGLTWDVSRALSAQQSFGVQSFYPLESDQPSSDNINLTGQVRLDRRWRRHSLGLRLSGDYQIVGEDSDEDGSVIIDSQQQLIIGPELVWRHDLGPQLATEISAGVSAVTRTDDFAVGDVLYVPEGSAAAIVTDPKSGGSVRVGYARQAAPNIQFGEVFVNDQLDVIGRYPLLRRRRLTASGGAGVQRGRQVDTDGARLGDSSMVYLADAALSWEVAPNLALSVRYQFRKQDAGEGSALNNFTSNTALLSIGGTYPGGQTRRPSLAPSQRVDGSDQPDPFGQVNRERAKPR